VLGCQIIEGTLCSSTDVSELVGSFEQVDANSHYRELASNLVEEATSLLVHCAAPLNEELVTLALESFVLATSNAPEVSQGINDALELLSTLNRSFPQFGNNRGASLEQSFRSIQTIRDGQGSFTWRDGPLVEAMRTGHWLHLRNVNLCSSSVLDRLNPVMEPGGTLHLAEVGLNHGKEDQASMNQREIKPHPNFRVFLSMDPKNGEISRAMRNRCVELFVPSIYGDAYSDADIEQNVARNSTPNSLFKSKFSGVDPLALPVIQTYSLVRKRSFDFGDGVVLTELQRMLPPNSSILLGW